MQFQRFTSGGFVLHRITHLSASRVSAWFDAQGRPTDAEFPELGRAVQVDGPVWRGLEALGAAWAAKAAA